MTLEQARNSFRRNQTPSIHSPRLRLKPKAPRRGDVDGAWWPRSDDLSTELPDLLGVLASRLRGIDRVTYNLDEWVDAPTKLATDERPVQLNGHHFQPNNTLEVQAANRDKIVLLVVPFNTHPDHAYGIVMAAAAPSNDSSVDGLLEVTVEERQGRTQATVAQERWESRGVAR